MEKTFKRSNRPNCMLMPVEEYNKTEVNSESKRKENKGKLIFREGLPSQEWMWEVKVILEILWRNRKRKRRTKASEESEGKKGKKNHNAINNEEKRWIYKLNPLDCPLDDWFKMRMITERVFKKRKRKRNIWIKEELELQS